MKSLLRALAVASVLTVVVSNGYAGDLDDLLARLPETANTVCVVNVKAMRSLSSDSPEGYQIVAGAIVPPAVDIILYGTQLVPGELNTRKTCGVVKLNRPATISDVVGRTSGSISEFSGTQVVVNPTKGYYAMLKPDLVAFGRQVTRQEFARWYQFARGNEKVVVSKYLAGAVDGTDAPMVGAIDMENQLDPMRVHDKLVLSKTMEGFSKEDIAKTAALISGMRGVTMTVRGKALDEAEVRFDFAEPVGDRADLVKFLFSETVNGMGVSLPEFAAGKAVADGNTVKLTTKLSDDGLMLIMSMFMPPVPSPKPAKEPTLEANGVSLQATQKYFNRVNQIVDDVRKKTKNAVSADDLGVTIDRYNKAYQQFDTAAKQIDGTPARYVDPDMLKYGENMAAKLHTCAMSMHGVIVDVKAMQSGMAYLATGGIWGGSIDSNVAATRQKQAEAVAADANRRNEILFSLDSDRREILRLMNERYKADFSKPIR
ncbi:MAG TPA: hypothetical protein VKS79_26260 [Gemmataceae bacterium]|nr:hypothetical protein [Gemmataceae bacterium]